MVKEYNSGDSGYIYDLSPGKTYYAKVRAIAYDSKTYDKIYGSFSIPIKIVTSPSGRPSQLKQIYSTTSSVSVSWKAVQGATGYKLSYYYGSNYESAKTITLGAVTHYTLKELKKDSTYSVKIWAFRHDGTYVAEASDYSNIDAKTMCGKVTWSKVKGATNYTIYISTAFGGGYKKTGTTKKTSFTISKYNKKPFKMNKWYYIKVVANKKVNSKIYKSKDNEINMFYFYQ